MSSDKKYPAIQPHGGLEKVVDNIYIVQGSYKMMPGTRISLTMTIVVRGSDVTIINSMRVNSEVEEEIKKLGTIKNVVRICANHGSSDEYYIDTFNATYYDLPGGADIAGATKTPKGAKELPDEFPISDAKVIMIENLKYPEAAVLLPDGDGTLITADFIQNGRPAPHKSFMGSALTSMLGFNTGCCSTPPLFFKAYGDGKDIYQPNAPGIMELDFENIVTGEFEEIHTFTLNSFMISISHLYAQCCVSFRTFRPWPCAGWIRQGRPKGWVGQNQEDFALAAKRMSEVNVCAYCENGSGECLILYFPIMLMKL